MSTEQSQWKARGSGAEAHYIFQKEQEQISALRQQHLSTPERSATDPAEPAADKMTDMSKEMRSHVDGVEKNSTSRADEIEGGFGGQEELEDRYATTSGEH